MPTLRPKTSATSPKKVRLGFKPTTWEHDKCLLDSGYDWVIGADEVGRGCVAGPIVACALRLDAAHLNLEWPAGDSKSYANEALREAHSHQIQQLGLPYAVASRDADFIDRFGIQKANTEVFVEAVTKLLLPTGRGLVLLDGTLHAPLPALTRSVVRGESTSLAIASASVVAKVYRDALMSRLSSIYPGYSFEAHKGYGTEQHLNAIRVTGLIPGIHRRSFLTRI